MIHDFKKNVPTVVVYLLFLYEISAEKLIINTDAGADDAVALTLLFRYLKTNVNSSWEVIGITCSYGNTEEKNVETNVLRTLSFVGCNDIPVYGGAKQGFVEPFSTDNYFGSDGFGDNKFDEKITTEIDKSKNAAVALVDMVRQHSGNVSILSLAPLTNIALAMSLDSNFTKHVRYFYTMGGSVAGVGNKKPNVEFNIGADPESAFALLNATTESQITLVPWETVRNSKITKDWRKNVLGKMKSPYIEFLNKVERKSLSTAFKSWISADAMTVVCMIEPQFVTEYTMRNVQVVMDGLARGSMLVDYEQLTGKTKNAKIVTSINGTIFKEMILKYLTCDEIAC